MKRRKGLYNYETMFCCPKCKNVFTYKEMWTALAKRIRFVKKISDLLECSPSTVFAAVTTLGLEASFRDMYLGNKWHETAEKLGYKSTEDMFYDMVIKRQWSFRKMAKLFGVSVNVMKYNIKMYLTGKKDQEE